MDNSKYKIKRFEQHSIPNLPDIWYHGTNKDFNKFDLKYLGSNWEFSKLGIYFTQHIKIPYTGSTAEDYAKKAVDKSGGSPIIYKCKLHLENPLILSSKGYYSSNTYIDVKSEEIKIKMEEGNHDGVIIYHYSFPSWEDCISMTNDINKIEILDKMKLD
jgi:hypothetical protein